MSIVHTAVPKFDTSKFTPWYKEQLANNQGKRPKHLAYATNLTKFGHIDYEPKHGYFRRHGEAKRKAARLAVKNVFKGDPPKLHFPHRAAGTWIYADFGTAPVVETNDE